MATAVHFDNPTEHLARIQAWKIAAIKMLQEDPIYFVSSAYVQDLMKQLEESTPLANNPAFQTEIDIVDAAYRKAITKFINAISFEKVKSSLEDVKHQSHHSVGAVEDDIEKALLSSVSEDWREVVRGYEAAKDHLNKVTKEAGGCLPRRSVFMMTVSNGDGRSHALRKRAKFIQVSNSLTLTDSKKKV